VRRTSIAPLRLAGRVPHIGHRRRLSKRDGGKYRPDVHTKIPQIRPDAQVFGCNMRAGPGPPPESRSDPQQRAAPGTDEERLPCRRSPSKQPVSPGGGVAIFGGKGATRHGRHRLHSAGNSRGARRLLRRQAVEDEGPMGHRVAEPGLSTLRHVHARDPPARINCGSDVGRMDVPEMRLQGRQVWARAPCTLRRHARVPQVGAVAPGRFQPRRIFELVSDDVVAAGYRRAEPATMNQAMRASEARRLDKGQPVPSACKQVAFATNSNSLGISGVVTYCGWVAA
jgi:hypothetical protein